MKVKNDYSQIIKDIEKRLGNYECDGQLSIFDYEKHPEYLEPANEEIDEKEITI